MNEQINNGGPVFPIEDCASLQFHGMTLRDYFASHAPEVPGSFMRIFDSNELEDDVSWRVRWALAYADAMLAARGDA